MVHVGQKGTFGAVGGFGFLHGLAQSRFVFFALGDIVKDDLCGGESLVGNGCAL